MLAWRAVQPKPLRCEAFRLDLHEQAAIEPAGQDNHDMPGTAAAMLHGAVFIVVRRGLFDILEDYRHLSSTTASTKTAPQQPLP